MVNSFYVMSDEYYWLVVGRICEIGVHFRIEA